MRPILVAQYRELFACNCASAVSVQCSWCDAPLRTHAEEIRQSGPDAEILCARCCLIASFVRNGTLRQPILLNALQDCVARHMAMN